MRNIILFTVIQFFVPVLAFADILAADSFFKNISGRWEVMKNNEGLTGFLHYQYIDGRIDLEGEKCNSEVCGFILSSHFVTEHKLEPATEDFSAVDILSVSETSITEKETLDPNTGEAVFSHKNIFGDLLVITTQIIDGSGVVTYTNVETFKKMN